jgi:Tol biopolymer transport system component
MRLAPGVRLGDYQVISLLGAGGMGEVYRARDATLNRDVAIKLVHSQFCENQDSLTRLRREARLLASINHPNVATLHELAEFGDGCGLVMELVSGETLADLIAQRPFSVAETLRVGAQIAAGLEAAHERGLVHRDLKPANIKITSDGHAKVLDFGLAKVDAAGPDAADATTILTEGAVVGTVAYMSPEQARGLPVDRRTDLWALGCVLFEMLTGRRAFTGASHSDILVSILERDPDFSSLPPGTPPVLDRLIRRCLTKDARRRCRDAGDARLDLEDAAITPAATALPAKAFDPSRDWGRMAIVLAAGAVIGAVIAAAWFRQPGAPAARQVQFPVTLPDGERLAATDLGEIAISPDGRNVVYVAARGTTTQLSLHSLDGGQSTPLRDTLNAVTPFFSADGQWVGFFADGKLKKVALAGGTPQTICDAANGLGGSWGADGTIVFASATGSPLQRVAHTGGTPSRATELDVSRGEFSHRWPSFLPDGKTFLFSVGTVGDWDEAEIFAQTLDGQRTLVLKGGTNARYLDAGYLAYGHKGAIWIVPFDAKGLKVNGTPQKVIDGVAASVDGAAQFGVSPDSTVVYVPANLGASARRLVVVHDGESTPLAAAAHAYVTPRLSPDGRQVALGVSEAAEHIWVYDLNAPNLTQLTFEAANRAPAWSPDGRVTFASNRHGALNLFSTPATGNGPTERVSTSDYLQMPGSWSPDGQTLALMEQNPATGRDIWLLRSTGERTAFANSPADESAPRFSPDGRWIAYVSNESGQAEVYVRPAAGTAPPRKVSAAGGMEPVWRPRDGAALYYRVNDTLMTVPMRDGVPAAAPRVAFDGPSNAGTFDAAGYDVMTGDRLLVINNAPPASSSSQLRVILNWAPGAAVR